jgi:hypothetical protein
MSLLALPLLLAAAQPVPKPVAYQPATASVQIIATEEIRFEDMQNHSANRTVKGTVRQTRRRDGMPMVEFY